MVLIPLNLVLQSLRKYEASLGYTVSTKLARVTQTGYPVSKCSRKKHTISNNKSSALKIYTYK